MYDWANSAFVTTIMAAVLPVYYHQVAASTVPENMRTVYWGYTQTVALIVIAVIGPILGAAADYLGAKKKFLASFVGLGVLGFICSTSPAKETGSLPPRLSSSATSAMREARSFTNLCSLTLLRETKWTESPRRVMPWATSEGDCFLPSNSLGS